MRLSSVSPISVADTIVHDMCEQGTGLAVKGMVTYGGSRGLGGRREAQCSTKQGASPLAFRQKPFSAFSSSSLHKASHSLLLSPVPDRLTVYFISLYTLHLLPQPP